MRLIQVLAIVLTQLSIGSLLMTSLLPPRELRLSFFTFNSLLSAIAAALALVLSKTILGEGWRDVRLLGLAVIGATVAYGCFRLEKPNTGRLFLVLSGMLGLIFGVLPLAGKALAIRGWQVDRTLFFDASVVAGTLLLGAASVGMILGHWYLIMRRLSFEHLERFTQIVMGAAGFRAFIFVVTLSLLGNFEPRFARVFIPNLWSPQGDLWFTLARIVFGLALPLLLALFAFRCVKEKANQAATGLLYVVEICVLFGELFAAYLMI
jgi:hypothetical protein